MSLTKLVWTIVSIFVYLSISIHATALGDLAASMQAGEWAELQTNNLGTAQDYPAEACASTIYGYSEDAAWDSNSEQFFFLGGNHCYSSVNARIFLSYSASTNSWRRDPHPGDNMGGNPHGYGYTAIDPLAGELLWTAAASVSAGYGDRSLWKYNIASDNWTEVITPIGSEDFMTFGGIEYLTELGRVVEVGAGYGTVVNLINPTTGQYTRVQGSMPMGNGNNFVEYNPVHQCVIFGGGDGNTALYKMDAAGDVTRMSDTPFVLRTNTYVLTVDPVSGDFLVFNSASGGSFYVYDVVSDTWTLQGGDKPPIFVPPYNNDASAAAYSIIAAPVSNYGVTMFVKGLSQASGKVYIYKHSAETTALENRQACVKGGITAFPNPFADATRIGIPQGLSAQVSVKVCDLRGRVVADLSAQARSGGTLTWQPDRMANGVYLLKAFAGQRTLTRRLLYQR